jgi:hypothetical protein
MMDEYLHLHFDYFAMNQRRLAFLYKMREEYLANADSEPETMPVIERKKAEFAFRKCREHSNTSRAQFLKYMISPEGVDSVDCHEIISATLLSDPASIPDAEKNVPRCRLLEPNLSFV